MPVTLTGSRLSRFLANRSVRVGLTLAMTAGILTLLIVHLDVTEIVRLLRSARPDKLVLMILISIGVNVLIASDKYLRIVALTGNRITYWEAMFLRLGTMPLKFVFPGKIGEFAKALYLYQKHDIPVFQGVGTVVYDKITNAMGILVLILIGSWFSARSPVPTYVYVIICCGLATFPLLRLGLRRFSSSYSTPTRFLKAFDNLFKVLRVASPRANLGFILYGTFFEASEVVNVYLALQAIGYEVPFTSILAAAPLMILVSNVPITLSGLGTREASLAYMLAVHAPWEALVSAGFLVSLIEYIFPTIIGTAVFPLFMRATFGKRMSYQELAKTVPSSTEEGSLPRS